MSLKAKLLDWIRANWVMLSNASSLIGTMAVTSGLGFVYWWVAAHQYPAAAVGLASATISAMTLLGTVSMWGLGTLLIGQLPQLSPARQISFIITALLLASVAGGILGLLFVPWSSLLSPELSVLATPGNALLFAVGVGLTALTLVLDQALIGLLRGGVQLWRNGFFAFAKLIALIVVGFTLSDKLGLNIYATWVLGNLVSLVALGAFATYKGVWKIAFRPDWSVLQGLKKSALSHHALNLGLLAPSLTLPVLVTILLSATANAHFYVAWMIASFIFVGPGSLALVLYAVGAGNPQLLAQKVRLAIKLTFLIGLAANLVLTFTAGWLLGFFGSGYASEAEWCLRLLGLGTFALAIKDFYVTIHRIYGQLTQALLPVVIGGIMELVLASLGAIYGGGLIGLSLGWLIASCLEAVYMTFAVYRAANPPKSVPAVAPVVTTSHEQRPGTDGLAQRIEPATTPLSVAAVEQQIFVESIEVKF